MSIEDQLEYMNVRLERIARSLETIALLHHREMPDPTPEEIYFGQPESVQESEQEVQGDEPRGDSHREVYEEAEGPNEPLGEREREIISLSRRMGVEYLVHDGMVVVDASVMDEYRRLHE